MSIFLSKFLPQFIYPTGLVFLLLILALIFHRRRRLRNGLLIASVIILFFAGNRWVSTSLVRSLEWQYPPLPDGQNAPVMIVLAGGTEPLEHATANRGNERGWRQGALLRRTCIARARHRSCCSAAAISPGWTLRWLLPPRICRRCLLEMGVPQEALILETRSQNTSENAANCAGMLKERGISEAILVTSAAHMPRSMLMFADQGLELIPAPTDYAVTEESWARLWRAPGANLLTNLMPSTSALGQTTNALKEYIGMLWYLLGRGL